MHRFPIVRTRSQAAVRDIRGRRAAWWGLGRGSTRTGGLYAPQADSLEPGDATLASAFVARWCVGAKVETAGGVFRVREDEPAPRVGMGLRGPRSALGRPLERRAGSGGVRGVEIGEYRGVVQVSRRVFQRLLPERPTPERCVEAYCLQRPGFESIAERKLHRRQLTEDGNVEITGRDLREGSPTVPLSAGPWR
jgi:hypothetical protein